MATTTTEPSPPTMSANAVFIGPAFNTRLALAQTDQLTLVTPAQPIADTPTQAPNISTEPMSLLTLLSAKAPPQPELSAQQQAQLPPPAEIIKVAADSAIPAETPSVQLAPVHIMIDMPITTDTDVDAQPEDMEDTSESIDSGNLIVASPVIAAPAPKAATNTDIVSATDFEDASGGITQSNPRISLFDRLSNPDASDSDIPLQNAAPESVADVGIAAAPITDLSKAPTQPLQLGSASTPQPELIAASIPAAPADVPTVTMRPHNPAQLVEGVSVLVARASKSAINEFVIRIDPPELGRIDVQLKMHDDGTVKAVIASDNASTYDLLRREASTIERALTESGLRTGSDGLSFNLKQQNNENPRNLPSSSGSSRADGAMPDESLPAAVITPLRQRYENARINISA